MFNLTEETTGQVIFDHVVEHLFTQKVTSQLDGHCMYRGPNNTSCAVDCLIPDEFYDYTMEGEGLTTIFRKKLSRPAFAPTNSCEAFFSLLKKHQILLTALQGVHDAAEHQRSPLSYWNRELRLLAPKMGLQFNYTKGDQP